MAKYLITGGCGFIGSHLAHLLTQRGDRVAILDDLSTGRRENIPESTALIVGSITDPPSIEEAIEGIDGLFHLAAVPSVQQSVEKWSRVHEINLGGTVKLFEALTHLPQRPRVIYASSAAIYGASKEIPLSEKSRTAPLSPYGIDKLAGEWQAEILWNLYGIPSVAFRFFNVYGPRQDPSSPYSGVISLFKERLAQELPFTICGDGEQQRDFISVFDVVRAMALTMKGPMKGAKVYNLCSGCGTTVNQLVELMEKIAGTSVEKEYAAPREGDIRLSIGDPSEAEKALGFKPQHTLEEGLKLLMHPLQGVS